MQQGDTEAVAQATLAELCRRFPLPAPPRIVWKDYRTTAGRAYYRDGVIGLGRHVLREERAVRETVMHEYAHLLAVHRQGPKAAGHGPAWRAAMREMGLEPRVTHGYEVQRNVPRQRVSYLCLRCGRVLTRARRLPRGRRYAHASCGGDLRLAKVERVTVSDANS